VSSAPVTHNGEIGVRPTSKTVLLPDASSGPRHFGCVIRCLTQVRGWLSGGLHRKYPWLLTAEFALDGVA